MFFFEVLIAFAIAAGLVGVIIPLMPGSVLIGAAVLSWAAVVNESAGWVTFVIAGSLLALGSVIKYVVPGKRMADSGVPTQTLVIGGVAGVVGFFVIPVVGLPLGFVGGVYLAERQRGSAEKAWPATVEALKAVGLGILIELVFGVLAAGVWLTGALVT